MAVILAFGKMDFKFEASLTYMARPVTGKEEGEKEGEEGKAGSKE